MRMMKLTASSACFSDAAGGISSSAASAFGPRERPSSSALPCAVVENVARTKGLVAPAYLMT